VAVRVLIALLAAAAVLAAPASAARVAPAERRQITAVLDRFVPAALERKDLRLAYELSGPYVRGGMTLREWLHGGIPVYPYPAAGSHFGGWLLSWRDGDELGLSLLIQPRKGAKTGPIAFDVQMTKQHGRWLVNAFLPRAMFAGAGKPAKVFSERDLLPNGSSRDAASGRLSPLWFAVPGGLLGGLVIVVPLGYLLYARRRDARAYREYLAARGEA
jgi:hypothetical protein